MLRSAATDEPRIANRSQIELILDCPVYTFVRNDEDNYTARGQSRARLMCLILSGVTREGRVQLEETGFGKSQNSVDK